MTPHITDRCPVDPDTWVVIRLGPGDEHVEQARHVGWGPGEGPDGLGRVHAYAVITPQPAAPALAA